MSDSAQSGGLAMTRSVTGNGMRREPRKTRDYQLSQHASTTTPPSAALPLVHITTVGLAEKILAGGYIEPRACTVFKKGLVYFFVMRPAFRKVEGDEKSHRLAHFPVAFITTPQAVPNPYHVYPTDTGGAASGRFGASEASDPALEDYELPPTRAAAAAHIGWAFETLDDYMRGLLRSGLVDQIPYHDHITHAYYEIARSTRSGDNQPDGRASTVEIASADRIALKHDIELAILPKQLREDKNVRNQALIDALTSEQVVWRDYDWQPNSAPNTFLDEIDRVAREWYGQQGIL